MIKTLGRKLDFLLHTEAAESIKNNLPVNLLLEVTATNVVPNIIEHNLVLMKNLIINTRTFSLSSKWLVDQFFPNDFCHCFLRINS